MADYGHTYADKKLIGIERKMKREYQLAYKEMKEKADKYFKQFAKEDAEMLKKYKNKEITKKQYIDWRKSKMLTGSRYRSMLTSLTRQMTATNKTTMSMINDSIRDVFVENLNYGAYEVCKGLNSDIAFTIYNQQSVDKLIRENTVHLPRPKVDIPKDLRWNRKKIASALMQGIMQGDSIDKIAKRLRSVTDMNKVAAIRNARTLTTGAQNGGRLERYKEAKAMGIDIMKKWEATLDHVTRESHVDVDGEVQPLDHPFSNGLDYPGGMGPPEEVYNCRCTMVSEIKGHKYDNSIRMKALGGKSYAQWKAERGSHGKSEQSKARNQSR